MQSFTQADLESLKKEYVASLKNIKVYYVNFKKKQNQNLNAQARFELGILNHMASDLFSSILEMEKFLPRPQQFFLNRQYTKSKKTNLLAFSPKEGEYTPENLICDLLMQKKLLDTLHKTLTPRQFEVVYLFFYEAMSTKDISLKLKISRPTVTEHLEKALGKIRSSSYIQEILKNLS